MSLRDRLLRDDDGLEEEGVENFDEGKKVSRATRRKIQKAARRNRFKTARRMKRLMGRPQEQRKRARSERRNVAKGKVTRGGKLVRPTQAVKYDRQQALAHTGRFSRFAPRKRGMAADVSWADAYDALIEGFKTIDEKRDYNWQGEKNPVFQLTPGGDDGVWVSVKGKRARHLSKKEASELMRQICKM